MSAPGKAGAIQPVEVRPKLRSSVRTRVRGGRPRLPPRRGRPPFFIRRGKAAIKGGVRYHRAQFPHCVSKQTPAARLVELFVHLSMMSAASGTEPSTQPGFVASARLQFVCQQDQVRAIR
jgi:hypothetical protein